MLFNRKTQEKADTLKGVYQFVRELSLARELKSLQKSILSGLTSLSGASEGKLLLREMESKSFVVSENQGGPPLKVHFSFSDPFLNFVGQTGSPLSKKKLLNDRQLMDVKEVGLKFFQSVHGDVIFPMLVESKLIGFAILGGSTFFQTTLKDRLQEYATLIAIGAMALDSALLHESLIRQNQKLAELAQLKTEFCQTVSHELSTPVHGILGMAEILADPNTSENLTDNQQRYLQMILSATHELGGVVDEILNWISFQAHQGALEVKKVDLYAVWVSLENEMSGVLEKKQIRIKFPQSSSIQAVYGDVEKIKLLFSNLIGNAIKFSSNSSIKEVSIHVHKQGDFLQICVSDQGVGVREEAQHRIFEEFRQAEADLTRSHGGAGLGLALAKKIVEMHGGRIWVESKEGEGANFFLTLPIKPDRVQVQEIDLIRR